MKKLTQNIIIDAPINWFLREDKKTGRIICSCDELNITLELDHYKNYLIEINNSMNDLFKNLIDKGDLIQFLGNQNLDFIYGKNSDNPVVITPFINIDSNI